jgi:cell division transport system ATP-binding protein
MIKFKSVSKIYGSRIYALVDINLEIPKGEFVFITGRSGAGKSTLLKLLYADQKPSKGEVIISGLHVEQLSVSRLAHLRRHMGIVFQDFKLLWNRDIFGNVTLPLQIWGKSREEILQRAEKTMKELDLWKYKDVMPHQLSGGEQQRVAIARAVICDPWIIIADEPTGNLDAGSAMDIFEIFKKISGRGTTILFATHNERLISMHKGKTVRLENGKIV